MVRLFLKKVITKTLFKIDTFFWYLNFNKLRIIEAPKSKNTILVCGLITMLASVKIETIITSVLRLRGSKIVVLLVEPNNVYEKVFMAAIPDVDFVYFDDYSEHFSQGPELDKVLNLVSNFEGDVSKIVDFEIDEVRVGRNALSRALRTLRLGKLDFQNPKHKQILTEVLADSLVALKVAERIIEQIMPDVVIFNERGYTPAGEMFDVCIRRQVDVIQWCGAPISNSLIYKRYDKSNKSQHPISISGDSWDRLKSKNFRFGTDAENVIERIKQNYQEDAFYNHQQLQSGKVILDAETVKSLFGLKNGKKTAVIFSHILYDATFFYGESLFPDYETWLIETVRSAIANPNLNWVVKVHPVNLWRSKMDGSDMEQLEKTCIEKEFGSLPDHVSFMPACTDVNTLSLFSVIDYGITVRGTIGMELPCFGIPVVTAGTGRYSGLGFTEDPVSRQDYLKKLANLQNVAPLSKDRVELAVLHYNASIFKRPVLMESFTQKYPAEKSLLSLLGSNVSLTSPADETLSLNKDLCLVSDWVLSKDSHELFSRESGF